MIVIGIGEKKTPQPFISSCNKLIYIEILKVKEQVETENETNNNKRSKTAEKQNPLNKIDVKTIKLIKDSVNDLADETGWTFLGNLGNLISKKKPDFDPRNNGFTKLYPLIKHIGKFEIDERDTGVKNIRHIYLKLK